MIRNYFKIAWRNIYNNKVFSFINIIGLAIGFSASFVIGLMIYYDMTFDKFHSDNDQIYRITSNFTSPEGDFYNPGAPVPLGVDLKENFSGLKTVSTFFTTEFFQIKKAKTGKIFKDPEQVVYVDENYFKLFNYVWLSGNKEDNLSNPNEVVLTEDRAKKYFPNLSPHQVVGRTLIYGDSITVNITGVVKNFKKRSDLIFEEFISLKTALQSDMKEVVTDKDWNSTTSASQLFVKIEENADSKNIQAQLNTLAKEHEDKQSLERGQKRTFYLQPLSDIHFNENYGVFDYSNDQASKSVLVSLSFVALFLLLLGCINFINLNTAQAVQRSKDIGIRKTLGGSNSQLILQFLSETFLLTLAAALISIIFSSGLFRMFSDFIPENLKFDLLFDPVIIGLIVSLLIIVALLSGLYPALVLTKFKPISVMRNQTLLGNDNSSLRKYLTVFQFVIAQVFIIATILISKQIHFLMNKDMGFKTEAVAFVRTPWDDKSMDKRLRFIKEIKALPELGSVSFGGDPPASRSTHTRTTTYFSDKKEIHTGLQLLYGDQNYLNLYNIELLAGRKPLNDTIREYVINETYLKILGFKTPQDAINKILVVSEERNPIVGVMKDFNQRSLKSNIKPMAFIGDWSRKQHSRFNTIHFTLQTKESNNWSVIIGQIEKVWKSVYPDREVKVNFIDESVKKFYRQEQKMSLLLNWATGLSILISCLGLLGLVIYTTERRTKEIGIRKVLGSSLAQLNLLLCKDFLVLVIIAFAIAAPIAWWGVNNWLEDFAYKTNLSWWVFLLSGITMLLITILIMSVKTLSAASANPIKSLKTE